MEDRELPEQVARVVAARVERSGDESRDGDERCEHDDEYAEHDPRPDTQDASSRFRPGEARHAAIVRPRGSALVTSRPGHDSSGAARGQVEAVAEPGTEVRCPARWARVRSDTGGRVGLQEAENLGRCLGRSLDARVDDVPPGPIVLVTWLDDCLEVLEDQWVDFPDPATPPTNTRRATDQSSGWSATLSSERGEGGATARSATGAELGRRGVLELAIRADHRLGVSSSVRPPVTS